MFCPRCGSGSLQQRSEKEFACGCGFHYFQNVASAVMVALCWQDELLVAVRARDPGKGLLDLPGGFVAFGAGPVRVAEEDRQASVVRAQGLAQVRGMVGVEDRDGAHVSSCQKPAQS